MMIMQESSIQADPVNPNLVVEELQLKVVL